MGYLAVYDFADDIVADEVINMENELIKVGKRCRSTMPEEEGWG